MNPAGTASGRADDDLLSERERQQIERANADGHQPVVFVHGLWLLQNCWDRWAAMFEDEGFVALTPEWPGDPDNVEEANARPQALAGRQIGEVARHHESLIRHLDRKPVVIGHSFGGALAQMLAANGFSTATVAIDPAALRGVLPLPLSALKAAWPALRNPLNLHRAVPLSLEQFAFSFANAVDETEGRALYEQFAVPGPAMPLFQAALENINPWTELQVDWRAPGRGPLLIISGERDNTVPSVVARAAYEHQSANGGVTEFVELAGRGHSLTIDHGWRDVAQTALTFVRRFV
jgi:non-heme chloroperoxidase